MLFYIQNQNIQVDDNGITNANSILNQTKMNQVYTLPLSKY